jgi:hypothetical protein
VVAMVFLGTPREMRRSLYTGCCAGSNGLGWIIQKTAIAL